MSEVIKRFVTSHDGVVSVRREEIDHGPTGYWYDAWWSPDFMLAFRVGQGSMSGYNLERILEQLHEWDSNLEPIEDLGEYQLFSRTDRGDTLAVSARQEYGCDTPIKAKDVPSGSLLLSSASGFFIYWKGEEVVDKKRRILLS